MVHILAGLSLVAGLLAGLAIGGSAVAAVVVRLDAEARLRLVRLAVVGLVVGTLATLVYDVAKALLAPLDPGPYDPFGAIPIFGTLLLGPSAGEFAATSVGFAYHLLNGISFGLAYVFLFARERASRSWAVGTGVVWGLFLETFQLTLYPGWLDIRAYQEFVQVSFLAHVAYGTALGGGSRWVMRRWLTTPDAADAPAAGTSR